MCVWEGGRGDLGSINRGGGRGECLIHVIKTGMKRHIDIAMLSMQPIGVSLQRLHNDIHTHRCMDTAYFHPFHAMKLRIALPMTMLFYSTTACELRH